MNPIALDVHCHLMPVVEARLAEIDGVTWHPDKGLMEVDGVFVQPKALYTPQALIDWLDQNAIDRGWVSVPPFVYRQGLAAQPAEAWASYMNDGLVDLCAAHKRLSPVLHLPVEHPTIAVAIARNWTAKGQKLFAMATGAGPDVVLSSEDYAPLWRALDEAGAFLLLHPPDSFDPRHAPFYLRNLLGNPYETAVAASHLIFGRVLERYPGMKICLAHCGGLTAFVAGRLERGLVTKRPGVSEDMMRPRDAVARFFVDCIAHDATALTLASHVFGADHVVFGSDWPYPMGLPEPHAQLADVDPPLLERILAQNPKALIHSTIA